MTEISRKKWEEHLSQAPQHTETRLSFMSEEHAREYRTEVSQGDGLLLTLKQSSYSTPIAQGALFAFR